MYKAFVRAKSGCDKWHDYEMTVAPYENGKPIYYGQHRTIWQEHSAKDFASYESYKRAGILYVFPPFITARMGQKIGRRPQTQLCGDAYEFTSCPAAEFEHAI